jgi:2'-5' RNA ligase
MARAVIASLPEARAALEAARSSGGAAELESPPDAAGIYGVLWFAELNRALLAEFPDFPFMLTLDCGERADLAHAALAEGIKRIRFSGHPEAAKALGDIARQLEAELLAPERLYVIAEPEMSEADQAWIQAIRGRYDPHFDLVGPHFTLVFGAEPSHTSALVAQTRDVGRRFSPFAFDLQLAKVLPEPATDHYLFLIPDLGARELVALHEALHFRPVARPPFMPHLTIGRLSSAAEADTLAAELNNAKRVVTGRVSRLSITAVSGRQARALEEIGLIGR